MEYTAHITADGRIHTVSQHSNDTAVLCCLYSAEAGLHSLGKLAGLVHDMGKMCSDFDQYINGKTNFTRGEIDHAYAGAKYLWEIAEKSDDAIREAARLIAHVVISHHGLHDWIKGSEDYFKERVSKKKRWNEIKSAAEEFLPKEKVQSLLEEAALEYTAVIKKINALCADYEKGEKRYVRAFYLGMVERFLQSCLVDADRTDTADFMENTTSIEPCLPPIWEEMGERMSRRLSSFSNKTDHISLLRKDISDRCAEFADHHIGTVRLVVPTGGGKTLSSLRFAIEYCKKQDMKKIIYTAPYMSILEQNSDEFRKVAGEDNFLEHHSDMFSKLDDEEELAEYELACERWKSPVIATTMVQFLNALFSGKMAAVRRFHRLSKAVIIIDEVQSIPIKCVHLFNLAMNFITGVMGAAVVLCSATQPVFDKTRYPLILDEKSSMTGDFAEDFKAFHRTQAVPVVKNGGYSFDDAAAFCMEKFRENGDLLVIVNTRKSAAEMFRRLSELNSMENEPCEMSHISTMLCPTHRKREIERLRKLLDDKKPVICVTTQLIEAGVDISFRCVVRALAGIDSIMQAAGRCNRHGNDDCRPVYIYEFGEENLEMLFEIKQGKVNASTVCQEFKADDLLSPEAATNYFENYYHEMEDKLSYQLDFDKKDKNNTLFNLLSCNSCHNPFKNLIYSGQAFFTAGQQFEVITNEAQAVIVPYNKEARNIILDLNGSIDLQQAARLQRKAQQYSVDIFDNELKKYLEEGIVYQLKCGVYALTEGYYDSELGIVKNGKSDVVVL